jgi:lipoprotein signal peptidase
VVFAASVKVACRDGKESNFAVTSFIGLISMKLPVPVERMVTWSGTRRLLMAYFFLFWGTLGLDQSTKFHAQSSLLTWTHPTQIMGYRADKRRVFSLGLSPSVLQEQSEQNNLRDAPPATSAKGAWLDLNFTYVRNPGAAWGSLARWPAKQRIAIFYGVTALATFAVAYLLINSDSRQKVLRLGLVFLLSGAVGNFVDRLLLGYVIDWIHLHWKLGGWEVSFPVFNVADAAVHLGLIALIFDVLAKVVTASRKETAV